MRAPGAHDTVMHTAKRHAMVTKNLLGVPMLLARSLLALLLFTAAPARAAAPDAPRVGLFRGRPVTYHLRHGQAVFEGDILLDHVTALPAAHGRAGSAGVGIAYGQNLWPRNAQGVAQIPYTTTSCATNLGAAITQFNTTFHGVIQLVTPPGAAADYVNFDFDTNNLSGQCESFVGRVGGAQSVGGSAACSLGTLLHELGHVVGLYHEMSRPDRNSYVTVNFNNVIKGSEDNFNQLSDNYQTLGLFDYASVMMYIPFAFSRNGGPVLDTIPAGMQLSNLTGYTASDIDSVERLYGAAPQLVTVNSTPSGLSVLVDGNEITTPQTYAWALNSKHTLGVHSGAQTITVGSGSNAVTNTYIYGRWNDSTAATHGITIKPGNNTVAQPATSPANTVYTANFVQLSPYTATAHVAGTGSVTVSPAAKSYTGAKGVFLVARQPVTLTPLPGSGYQFVTFGGTSAPYSANPKPDYVPDGGAAYDVTAYFSNEPITTVTTTPGGFYFTVDGEYFKAPQNFTADVFYGWGPGTVHTVTGFSPNLPYSVNTQYLFNGWSDGGALSHSITVPSGASTLTASYTAQYVPIVTAAPACGATITLSPATGTGFYTAGTQVAVTAKSAKGMKLTGWSGDLSGTSARQTLTVNDEELATASYNIVAEKFAVTSLTPASFASGSAGGTVKIKGDGFTKTSYVFVDNMYRPATYVSEHEIDIVLTSADLTSAGAFPIGVSSYTSTGSCGNYAALGMFVTY